MKDKKEILISLLAGFIIILFFYTGFSKILDMRDFHGAMHKQPLPQWLITTLIWTLPSIEIIVAILLLIAKTRKIGFILSTILMLSFTIYVGLGIAHAFKYVPCSCGGVIRTLTWPQHFVFNVLFLGIAVIGLLLEKSQKNISKSHQIIAKHG